MSRDSKVEKAPIVGKPFEAEGTTGTKPQGLADSKNREKLGRGVVREVRKRAQRCEGECRAEQGPFCHTSQAKERDFSFA